MDDNVNRRWFLKVAGAAAASGRAIPAWGQESARTEPSREWQYYGGDEGASRYSPLKQINRETAAKLKLAWVHHTEDGSDRPLTTIECTPIVVDGVMYLTTAKLQLRALDPATGKLIWNFDPNTAVEGRGSSGVNRGVAFWRDGGKGRIFFAYRGHMLCVDAATGSLVASFGDAGKIDLRNDLDHDMEGLTFNFSSPPVLYKDFLIVGGGGGEGPRPAAPGHIRGYDARTGKRRWIFHAIPRPGQFGHDTWEGDSWRHAGGANNWAGMSVDRATGMVFVSTGSPTFDFYGGDRKGQNLFGNSVIALDAETGKRIWHFQTVHHDVWDYDLPAQPALVKVKRGGRTIDAVAQVTKTGMLFLFERENGKPIFPIEERPVPQSATPGEQLWPTQPFPTKPAPYTRHEFTEQDITNVSPESHEYISTIFKDSKAGKIFTPPSVQGTVVLPGFLGGALWGGCSFDPEQGLLFVNSSENSNLLTLVEAEPDAGYRFGIKGYVRFLDQNGHPAIKPPWGYLTAIDLATGEYAWREVLGEHPELMQKGVPKTGTLNVGGSIATAGGLIFVAATSDEKFRAFDSATGETLWETQLEAGGYATPCTYEADGRQFVVIAAGGGGMLRTGAGDAIMAFALG
jgi:quinoprotein glucose dehydrogenase